MFPYCIYTAADRQSYGPSCRNGDQSFKENGKGAFNLNYYNPLTKQQVVDTRTIEWKNTKNTFQIYFINGDGNLYFKIDHLSKTQFIIYSGDYFYSEIKMNR